MKIFKVLVLVAAGLLGLHANATTAILCGDPDKVDVDNNLATLHLILDGSDSRTPEEIEAYSKGRELSIDSVSLNGDILLIQLDKKNGSLLLDSKYIDESSCEFFSEKVFTIQQVRGSKVSLIEQCRCFQD